MRSVLNNKQSEIRQISKIWTVFFQFTLSRRKRQVKSTKPTRLQPTRCLLVWSSALTIARKHKLKYKLTMIHNNNDMNAIRIIINYILTDCPCYLVVSSTDDVRWWRRWSRRTSRSTVASDDVELVAGVESTGADRTYQTFDMVDRVAHDSDEHRRHDASTTPGTLAAETPARTSYDQTTLTRRRKKNE